ncbi:MAG TPA: PKD domain-containing protein, partial [Candidatus Thermoplasmatota archaeon]|nr:PKD domain-containing protein [Candidatus Thermoplasmatota archaeon]
YMGQWVAVWEDLRNDGGDIYAQNIQPDGTLGVVANQPPVADFTWMPANPTTQTVVQFTDHSFDSDGYLVNWTWEFGDGTSSYAQHPTHQYSAPGTYAVHLTVKDDEGVDGTVSKNVVVSSSSSTFIITIKPGIGLGVSVSFKNNGSTDVLGEPWEITVHGGLLGRINTSVNGTIDIAAGKSETKRSGVLFGFGALSITAKIADATQSAAGTQILLLTLVKK